MIPKIMMTTATMPLAHAASLKSFIPIVLVNLLIQYPKDNKYKNASQ